MKKLYLLLLMLLFIPATNAVTPYQLDQSLPELSGYSLREVFQKRNRAMPDLSGATDLGDAWYRLFTPDVGKTIDYNPNNGYIKVNSVIGGAHLQYNIFSIEPNTTYTISYKYISSLQSENFIIRSFTSNTNISVIYTIDDYKQITFNSGNDTFIRLFFGDDNLYEDLTFQLQIEKGSQATPYQVPTNGPYSNVDVGQLNLSPEQIETYYNLYLDAIRYVGVHDPSYKISTEFFLISTFFMYLLIMGIGYFTKSKYLYFAGAILWFVPIFNYQNIFIITTSIIVFISHLLIIFYSDKDDVFE